MRSASHTQNQFFQIQIKPKIESGLTKQIYHYNKLKAQSTTIENYQVQNESKEQDFESKVMQRMRQILSSKDKLVFNKKLGSLREKVEIQTQKVPNLQRINSTNQSQNDQQFEIFQLKQKINNLEQVIIKNQFLQNQNENQLKSKIKKKIFDVSEIKRTESIIGEQKTQIKKLQNIIQQKDNQIEYLKSNNRKQLKQLQQSLEQFNFQSSIDKHNQQWSAENNLVFDDFQKKKVVEMKQANNFLSHVKNQVSGLLSQEICFQCI